MRIEIAMVINDRADTNDTVILATSVEELATKLEMTNLYKEVGDDSKFIEGIAPHDGLIIRYRESFAVFKFIKDGKYINLLEHVEAVEANGNRIGDDKV